MALLEKCPISNDTSRNGFDLRCWNKTPAESLPPACNICRQTLSLQVLENSSQAYISRYALGRDYHKVLRRRLAKLAEQINITLASSAPPFLISRLHRLGPVLEKALGEKSGLGWIGKHTLLLDKEADLGFLGEIYTNAPLPIDDAATEDSCGRCAPA